MKFEVFDRYPVIANNFFVRKNLIYGGLFILLSLIAYFQFGVEGISQTSNILRILLFIILVISGAWYINQYSKIIHLETLDDSIKIDDDELFEAGIYGFEVTQLHDYLEYTILTTKFYSQYKYFYIKIDDIQNQSLTRELLEVTQYIEGITERDFIHKILRYLKFK